MRVSDKLSLIDKVSRELQSRYRFDEIAAFFAEFDVYGGDYSGSGSKWLYSKAALQGVDNEKLIRIAQELGLDVPRAAITSAAPPTNWKSTSDLKLFISHISVHKDKAKRLKDCLIPFGIDGFVAHEDIRPTLEWQDEIERALHDMDALLAIHTEGFSRSIWTQREIGFALGRGVKIISFKMGEDPTGFISRRQALSRQNRPAEKIAIEVDALLAADPLTSGKLLAAKKARGLVPDPDAVPF
jgi:hypothetical protein